MVLTARPHQPHPMLTTPVPVMHHQRMAGHLHHLAWHHHLLFGYGVLHQDPDTAHFAPRPVLLHQTETDGPVDLVEIDPTTHRDPIGAASASLTPTDPTPWWRYTAQRIGHLYHPHGTVYLTPSSTPPTPDEEALLALYAQYRLTLGHPDSWTDTHLATLGDPHTLPSPLTLARPHSAEPDPLRLTRHGVDHWTYTRTSWSTPTPTPTWSRPRRALATLLTHCEDADQTLHLWDLYQQARPAAHLTHHR